MNNGEKNLVGLPATGRNRPASARRRFVIGSLLAGLPVVFALAYFALEGGTPASVVAARDALGAGDLDRAQRLARAVLRKQPRNAGALLIAGEVATRQNRWDEALRCYAQVPDSAGANAAVALSAAGDLLLHQGHASLAEEKFLRALSIDPGLTMPHNRLAFLYCLVGRRWESLPYLFTLIRRDRFSLQNLLLLGYRFIDVDLPADLNRYREASPGDILPLLGLAKHAMREGKADESQVLIRRVIAARPDLIEAQAVLGQLLLEAADEAGLAAWHRALPAGADAHPDVWVVRGSWSRRQGQLDAARRCFWEALVRAPNNPTATYQLGQLLAASKPELAERFAHRAAQLQQLGALLDIIYQGQQTSENFHRAAMLTESLGRPWEAWAWHRVAGDAGDASRCVTWPSAGLGSRQVSLSEETPLTLAEYDLANEIDLSGYELPEWPRNPREIPPGDGPPICFKDVAGDVGIDFTYNAAYRGQLTGRRMFQVSGGGVAALDYDGDRWPDLHFTQGGEWPPESPRNEFIDRLYRNLDGRRAIDVTLQARLEDEGFGQGVTVGDYNADGFADLYVANIGRNRLWMNCGDGTFTDATAMAGLDERRWTTSCLLADLNADGLPDIYDVNYVQGADVFERICSMADGLTGICAPTAFEPQPDNCYLNLGDGRFADITDTAGFNVPGGNGLGILAADFDHSGRLSLFVANDQDANFFFVNQTVDPDQPRFSERGALSGLAFGGGGRAQASMGVAAGDADGDGKLDLFVTNFYQEANALYLQVSDGLFSDGIDASGIRQAGFTMLGFGTQFIDGDLDGRPDVVVTNGHVDDFTRRGTPYRMHPQFFRNLGGGRFAEANFDACGSYFTREFVGRGLARLDFNRDGLADFAVSHLDTPAALVVNTAFPPVHHYLVVRLCGVKSARDAIGAKVTVQCGSQYWTQQLTAGDGYQASNERQMFFGLGAQKHIDRLAVAWPSGGEQVFTNLATDSHLILIEGCGIARQFYQ